MSSGRKYTSWAARALTISMFATVPTFAAGISSPASAVEWSPPPPVINDACGISQDGVKAPLYSDTTYTWNGTYLAEEYWTPTGGASSVTVMASYNIATNPQPADVSFTVTFGTEPDSSCVEAADVVTTRVVECNPVSGGTKVEFVYINTDDATNKAHTRPVVDVDRWDNGQSAFVIVTDGTVADGQSASHIGGDGGGNGTGDEFYLSPGTYYMTVATKEYGERKLPNSLFVPACNGIQPPKGDPLGGPAPTAGSALPKGKLTQVTATKMRVKAINKDVPRATTFKVVIDPKVGKTTTRTLKVTAGKSLVRAYKAPARTRFVLKAKVLVKDANGRLVNKWKVLTRSTLKAR